MTKSISLTQGKFTLVDDEDFEYLNQFKWCFDAAIGYAVRSSYRLDGGHSLMHREILQSPKGTLTDHVNGDKLDNRRSNLRICNMAENMRNAGLRSTNTSGYKGVSWNKNAKKFKSHITYLGKNIHLGYFITKIDAAHAYDEAAKKYFGEFARLNFP